MRTMTRIAVLLGFTLGIGGTVPSALAQGAMDLLNRLPSTAPRSPDATRPGTAAPGQPSVTAPAPGRFDAQGYRQPAIMSGIALGDPDRIRGGTPEEIRYYFMHLIGTANQTCPNVDARIPMAVLGQAVDLNVFDRDAMARQGLRELQQMAEMFRNPDRYLRDLMRSAVWAGDARADMVVFLERYGCSEEVNRILRNAASYFSRPRLGMPDPPIARLHIQRVAELGWGSLGSRSNCERVQRPGCERVMALLVSDQRMLSCGYGPVQHYGSQVVYVLFWMDSAPADFSFFQVSGDEFALADLRSAPQRTCPATYADAAAIANAGPLPASASASAPGQSSGVTQEILPLTLHALADERGFGDEQKRVGHRQLMEPIVASGRYRLLQCTYSAGLRFTFWLDGSPPNIAEIIRLDVPGDLTRRLGNVVLSACPPTLTDAVAKRREAIAAGRALLSGQPVASAQPASAPREAAAPRIAAHWRGQYTCGHGLIALRLTLAQRDTGVVDGTFAFGPTPQTQGIVANAFSLTGTFDPQSGHLRLTPGEWASPPPPGYVMVGVQATLRGEELLTDLTGFTGCQRFTLRRE